MRRFWTAIELTSSVLGFAWLFGPPSWQDANLRAVFTVLGIVVVLAGCFGVVALLPQRKSPYRWEEK